LRLQEEIARCKNDLTLFAWKELKDGRQSDLRGIFAVSPNEFQFCHKLRVPDEPLRQDMNFDLTNRGLRVDRNLANAGPGLLSLCFDCLELDPADEKLKWIFAKLGRCFSV
jgi:hypothetical protein